MNKYKWGNDEQTIVVRYPGSAIAENGYGWIEFQEYLSTGGQVDPYMTIEQILSAKLRSLEEERNRRVDLLTGTSDQRKMIRRIVKVIAAVNKKADGLSLSTNEETEIASGIALKEAIDIIDTAYDAAEAWLEDASRIEEEIKLFDVVNTPNWAGV